jgi:hypothetical protein
MTTITLELPDEVISTIPNLKQLTQEFITFVLEKNKPTTRIATDSVVEELNENQKNFLELIRNIKSVKAPYSSEEMVAMLRQGKESELTETIANYAK